jgi:hypothetical protein
MCLSSERASDPATGAITQRNGKSERTENLRKENIQLLLKLKKSCFDFHLSFSSQNL